MRVAHLKHAHEELSERDLGQSTRSWRGYIVGLQSRFGSESACIGHSSRWSESDHDESLHEGEEVRVTLLHFPTFPRRIRVIKSRLLAQIYLANRDLIYSVSSDLTGILIENISLRRARDYYSGFSVILEIYVASNLIPIQRG